MLGLVGAFAASACKSKESEPVAIPMPSGSAAVVPADSAGGAPEAQAASAAASASAAPTTTAAPATAPATPVKSGGSVDACCSALAALGRSGKDAAVKSKAKTASMVCSGIAKRVTSGETTRASALTSVRAQLAGVPIPGECK